MDQLKAIDAALRVAELGSFTEAARALGLTPAAVSKQVAGLEAHLGGELFFRTTRTVRLTSLGEAYLERCRPLVEELGAADQQARDLSGALSGTLTLAAPRVFGRRYVAPLVLDFLARWPQVRIDLRLSDDYVDLAAERVDLAVRVARQLPDSALLARRLGAYPYVLVASPGYLERHGWPCTPEALQSHEGLVMAWQETWPFREPELAVRPRVRLRCRDLGALQDAALAGLGVAALPLAHVAEALDQGALEQLLPERFALSRDVWVLRLQQRYTPELVQAFMATLVASLRF